MSASVTFVLHFLDFELHSSPPFGMQSSQEGVQVPNCGGASSWTRELSATFVTSDALKGPLPEVSKAVKYIFFDVLRRLKTRAVRQRPVFTLVQQEATLSESVSFEVHFLLSLNFTPALLGTPSRYSKCYNFTFLKGRK